MAPSEKIGGNNESLPSGSGFLSLLKDRISSGITTVTGDARAAIVGTAIVLTPAALASEMPEPGFESPTPVPGLVELPDGATAATHGLSYDKKLIYSHTLGLTRHIYMVGVGEVSVPDGYKPTTLSAHGPDELRYMDIAYTGDVIAMTLVVDDDGAQLTEPRVIYTGEQQLDLLEELVGNRHTFQSYSVALTSEGKTREMIGYLKDSDNPDDVDILIIEHDVNEDGEPVINVIKDIDNSAASVSPTMSGDAYAFIDANSRNVYVSNGGEPVIVPGAGINPILDAENGLLYSYDQATYEILVQDVVDEAPQVVGDITIDGVGVAHETTSGTTNILEPGEYTVTIPFKDNLGDTNILSSGLYEYNPYSDSFDVPMAAVIDTSVIVEDGVTKASFTFYLPENDLCRFVVVSEDSQANDGDVSLDMSTIEDPGTEPPVEDPDLYVHGESVDTEYGKIDASGDAYVDLDPATTPSDSDVMVGLTTEDPEDTDLLGHVKFSELVDDFSAGLDTDGAAARVDVIEGDAFEVRMTYGAAEAGESARAVPFTDFEVLATEADLVVYYGDEMLEIKMGETGSLADFQEETKNPNVKPAPKGERPSGCSVVPGTAGMLAILPVALLTRRRRDQ